jgi:glucokinase
VRVNADALRRLAFWKILHYKKDMEIFWFDIQPKAEEYLFAGDIGGTNASFALVGMTGGKLRVIGKFLFKTKEAGSIVQAVGEAKAEIDRELPGIPIGKCCVSAAGPVEGNCCVMTNASWIINGDELSRFLGMPVKIINDFTAISYALPLLDPANPREIKQILPPGEGVPQPSGNVRAVTGAGTGLGVSCLIETGNGFYALASEGGHTDFAGFDADSRALCLWLTERIGTIPETELFVSGQGLVNIFQYFYERAEAAKCVSAAFKEIAPAPEEEKPALIARAARSDPGCGSVMRLFVKMYGRVAANIAVTFLPMAGLYLAGGIIGKNEDWFLRDNAFMQSYLIACQPKIRDILKAIPVYIVKDYSVSLSGAANAARYLMREP